MSGLDKSAPVGVVGAGTMGAGIAQLAAQAGHKVLLFDAAPDAAKNAIAKTSSALARRVEQGKLDAAQANATIERIATASSLEDLASCALTIEAIVEDLDIKRALFAQLEAVVADDAILASNTSSISITSIARDLRRPQRFAGMHFFNPAPVMKLVEIVSGLATDPSVADTLFATGKDWGKVAVHAKSTPGFIVNRVARPFYAEALRLYEEQVADPATLDAILTEGAGFRMGPFALMDLIGNDVNYAVTCSVFDAYYSDPRYRPSIAQLERVNACFLGRKTGRGFYDYADGASKPAPKTEPVDESAAQLTGLSVTGESEIEGVTVCLTDGRTATQLARASGKPAVVLDLTAGENSKRIAYAASDNVPEGFHARLVATLAEQSLAATRLPDWPGLVAMRTVAMLANEAFEAGMQGVASAEAIDQAMLYGVNYPRGPIAWAREIGLPRVLAVLDAIHSLTGDPRYRASMALRFAAADG